MLNFQDVSRDLLQICWMVFYKSGWELFEENANKLRRENSMAYEQNAFSCSNFQYFWCSSILRSIGRFIDVNFSYFKTFLEF